MRCLIGAGNRGRNDFRRGFARDHFTNTHSPPPVYIWLPNEVNMYIKLYYIIIQRYVVYFRNLKYPLPDLLNAISLTGNVCQ